MADTDIPSKVAKLSDLEIAILLCLIAREHCIVDAKPELLNDLLAELRLIAGNVYGLTYNVMPCTADTTVDDLRRAFFQRADTARRDPDKRSTFSSCGSTPESIRSSDQRAHHGFPQTQSSADQNGVGMVNIIIAKNFDVVAQDVQLAALDILCSKQLITNSGPRDLPNPFLFIPLVPSNPNGLSCSFNKHLLDHIFSSYHHDLENGFPNVEDSSDWLSDDQARASSFDHISDRTSTTHNQQRTIFFTEEDIDYLRSLSESTTISPDINSYIYSICVFLRMNRGVAGGVTPNATSHIKKYARCLAPLQGVDFVFPALVGIAARQVYRHRIAVESPRNDRSLLYGSSLRAVEIVFRDLNPETIIEEVLEQVDAPV